MANASRRTIATAAGVGPRRVHREPSASHSTGAPTSARLGSEISPAVEAAALPVRPGEGAAPTGSIGAVSTARAQAPARSSTIGRSAGPNAVHATETTRAATSAPAGKASHSAATARANVAAGTGHEPVVAAAGSARAADAGASANRVPTTLRRVVAAKPALSGPVAGTAAAAHGASAPRAAAVTVSSATVAAPVRAATAPNGQPQGKPSMVPVSEPASVVVVPKAMLRDLARSRGVTIAPMHAASLPASSVGTQTRPAPPTSTAPDRAASVTALAPSSTAGQAGATAVASGIAVSVPLGAARKAVSQKMAFSAMTVSPSRRDHRSAATQKPAGAAAVTALPDVPLVALAATASDPISPPREDATAPGTVVPQLLARTAPGTMSVAQIAVHTPAVQGSHARTAPQRVTQQPLAVSSYSSGRGQSVSASTAVLGAGATSASSARVSTTHCPAVSVVASKVTPFVSREEQIMHFFRSSRDGVSAAHASVRTTAQPSPVCPT